MEPNKSTDSNQKVDFVEINKLPSLSDNVISGPGRKNNRLLLLVLIILLVLLIGGFYLAYKPKKNTKVVLNSPPKSSSSSQTPGITANSQSAANVSVTSSGFSPSTIQVKVNQAVVWTNNDSVAHYVIANDPNPKDQQSKLNSVNAIAPGKDFNFVFNSAGTYSYHDSVNSNLTGEVVVTK